MIESTITHVVRKSLHAIEEFNELDATAAVQFLAAVELACKYDYQIVIYRDKADKINVLLASMN